MSQVVELFNSREITNTSSTFRYVIIGAADEGSALTDMLAVAPSSDRGLYRTGYNVVHEGAGVFSGKIEYGVFSVEPGQQTVTFEISSTNTHVTHSKNTTTYTPSGVTAPNFRNAIGVSKDGKEITGVDVITPTFSMSCTQQLDASTVIGSYISALYNLTGKINNASFTIGGATFGTREVLYAGSRGSKRGTDAWEISHSFLMSASASGLSFGDITGVSKEGWQYLWVYSQQTDDLASSTIVSKPLVVCVEDVYDDGDFSVLGVV